MAQIIQETLVVTFSKLIKEADLVTPLTSEDTASSLEQIAQELVGAGIIVEVVKA